VKWWPKSLVGRTALFVTLILVANQILWFGLVRPLVFNRYVSAYQVNHPAGMLRLYVDLEWAVFATLTSSIGAYLIFYWLRRQLQDVLLAARVMGTGATPPRLSETGPEEIRALSRGFNQLAVNLEALEADRRLMLVGISHDLRTPITRLRLALELMSIRPDTSHAHGMLDDLEEMNAIIKQFTDFARTGREEEPAAGDLNQIVAEVCRRYQAIGKHIATDLDEIPRFAFRPLALRRLVTNLLDNAIRYGIRDVLIGTHNRDGNIVLTVMDRGPGMNSIDPRELIKPFAREDAVRGAHMGAGLGLSIVDRIAKDHGGALSLSNRPEGGMIATVTLRIN
jgi:two-component system, OmpR family, osmolarity sensor histidine kinase EnvZ